MWSTQVGSNVKLFKPGDRVLVGAITPDWGDPASQAGHSSQSGAPLGGWKFSNTKDGVFAEYFHVNEADANMALIPEGVADEAAVYCADMLSTGFMGAENGNIPIGGTVAVFAEGPVGLMATVGAKLRGAGLIIGVETVPKRQELARQYGADVIVDFATRGSGRAHSGAHRWHWCGHRHRGARRGFDLPELRPGDQGWGHDLERRLPR